MGSRKLSGPGGTLDLSGGAPHTCATRGFFMYIRRVLYVLTNYYTGRTDIRRPGIFASRSMKSVAARTASVRYRLCAV